MTSKQSRDIPASVRARLMNLAKQNIEAPTVKIRVITALAITCVILVSGTRRHDKTS